ncbi:MAG: phage holin family protein [Armatimonadetes bacterium]|nr:phage holin family protein [Armatimonadota bacterium]
MGRLLLRWILLALSVWGAAQLCRILGLGFVTDLKSSDDTLRFLLGVAVLALLNATLGNLLKFLTIPLNCLTLGLFSLVVNALVLMFAASLGLGYHLAGDEMQKFLAAFVGSLLISFINGLLGSFLGDGKNGDKD